MFAAIVVAFTGTTASQVVWAGLGPKAPSSAPCRPTVVSLARAVVRAREAASTATGGELRVVGEFRAALEPEWTGRTGLESACSGDAEAQRLLGAVERLRYAEERALRYGASDLALQRADVAKQAQALGGR